jgi:hypothetical protein
MKRCALAGKLGGGGIVVTWLLAGAVPAALASAHIDQAHLNEHRLDADACVVRAVVIYTDPYIGSRLTGAEIVAAIARMCEAPFRIYAEDLGVTGREARRIARRAIEAGLRGQLPTETQRRRLRDAW